jgi:hypothetical protein
LLTLPEGVAREYKEGAARLFGGKPLHVIIKILMEILLLQKGKQMESKRKVIRSDKMI